MVPNWSVQNPRSPVLPTVSGTAVSMYPVMRSWPPVLTLVQLLMVKM